MAKTLITAWEVVKHSPAQLSYNVNALCKMIHLSEYECFRDCLLGIQALEYLIGELYKIPKESIKGDYSSSLVYDKGDIVRYYDCYFKSLEDDNTISLSENPNWHIGWEEIKKFGDNDCLNELWEFMCTWLAYKVMARSMRYETYKIGGKGTTKYSEEFRGEGTGLFTVSAGEFAALKSQMLNDAQVAFENLLHFMQRKHECGDCDFSCFDYIKNHPCNNCAPIEARRGRRFFIQRQKY